MKSVITARDKQGRVILSDVVNHLDGVVTEVTIKELIEVAKTLDEVDSLILYIKLEG